MPDSTRTNASDNDYMPDQSVEWERSPIKTRARCRLRESQKGPDGSGSDTEEGNGPESLSQQRQTQSQPRGRGIPSGQESRGRRGRGEIAGRRGSGQNKSHQQNTIAKPKIKERPYCSHRCLDKLTSGSAMNNQCLNLPLHDTQHSTRLKFLRLVKQQLHDDTGQDTHCLLMDPHDTCDRLLRICVTAHRYMFVTKGVEEHNLKHMHNE